MDHLSKWALLLFIVVVCLYGCTAFETIGQMEFDTLSGESTDSEPGTGTDSAPFDGTDSQTVLGTDTLTDPVDSDSPIFCTPGSPLPSPDHRFDFSGTGTTVANLSGGEDGEVLGGGTLNGSGQVELDGEDDYVNLPNGILGNQDSVSIMVWATGREGPAFWRIFDFGITRRGEDPLEYTAGAYYIALTPETGFTPGGLALLVGDGGSSSEFRAVSDYVIGTTPLVYAAVVDGLAHTMALYVNGQIVSEAPYNSMLSNIDDVNNWLGRSQYSADPFFPGAYDEVRVYHQTLSPCEVSAFVALGPNVPN